VVDSLEIFAEVASYQSVLFLVRIVWLCQKFREWIRQVDAQSWNLMPDPIRSHRCKDLIRSSIQDKERQPSSFRVQVEFGHREQAPKINIGKKMSDKDIEGPTCNHKSLRKRSRR